MHLVEGDDATKEAIERLVNMLMRDEQSEQGPQEQREGEEEEEEGNKIM